MSLQQEIQALGQQFAEGVLAALRNASLEDLLADRTTGAKVAPKTTAPKASIAKPKESESNGGGRVRRSPSDIAHVTGLIVAKLREHKAGMRSEQIQTVLKLSKAEIVGPLTAALLAGRIRKTGERRATTYYAE